MGIMEIFTFVLMLCSVIQVVQNFNKKKKIGVQEIVIGNKVLVEAVV